MSQNFNKQPDQGPHSALAGLGVLQSESESPAPAGAEAQQDTPATDKMVEALRKTVAFLSVSSFHDDEDAIALAKTVNAALSGVAAPAGASDEHAQLMKFYGVQTLAELVDKQAYHIEKLQAKLPATPSLAPQRVREG